MCLLRYSWVGTFWDVSRGYFMITYDILINHVHFYLFIYFTKLQCGPTVCLLTCITTARCRFWALMTSEEALFCHMTSGYPSSHYHIWIEECLYSQRESGEMFLRWNIKYCSTTDMSECFVYVSGFILSFESFPFNIHMNLDNVS